MSEDNSAVWGASAPETSAACWSTVGPARSTAGWYATLLWMLPRPTAGMATACRFARAAHAQLASVCRGRLCAGYDAGLVLGDGRPMAGRSVARTVGRTAGRPAAGR